MKSRFLIPLGVFAALVVVFAIAIKHSPQKGIIASPLIGKVAPEFTLPDLSQPTRNVTSAELKGRWYLVNVWGSWCVACRQEHPVLLEAQKQGIVPIIGVDWKDNDDEARGYLNKLGNPYTRVLADREGRTAIDFGVYAAPESFLVNPDGVVVYKCMGEITPEIWEKEIVARIKGTASKT